MGTSKRRYPKQPSPAPQKQDEPRGGEPENKQIIPLVSAIHSLTEAYKSAHAIDCKKDNEQSSWNRKQLFWNCLMAIFTGLGFLAAAIYAGISYKQWYDFRNNFRVDERAWVSPYKVCAESPDADSGPNECGAFKKGGPMILKVLLRNTGKTFATHVTACIKASDIPEDATTFSCEPPINGLMPPNAPFNASTASVGPERAELVRSGTQGVVVTGIIRYDDIFRSHHWTSFCYGVRGQNFAFSPCPKYNDCDDCSK